MGWRRNAGRARQRADPPATGREPTPPWDRGRRPGSPSRTAVRASRSRQRPHVLEPKVAGELVDPPGPGGVRGVRQPHVAIPSQRDASTHVDALQQRTAITTQSNGTGRRRRLRRLRRRRLETHIAIAVAASHIAANQRSRTVSGSAAAAQARVIRTPPEPRAKMVTMYHVTRTIATVIDGRPNGVPGRCSSVMLGRTQTRPIVVWPTARATDINPAIANPTSIARSSSPAPLIRGTVREHSRT